MSRNVPEIVRAIVEEVRTGGDAAIKKIVERLKDKDFVEFSSDEVQQACDRVDPEVKRTISFAAANIQKFARATVKAVSEVNVQFDGYTAGMRFAPVERVACYVPAGRFPLPSTALMTTIPAREAGVKEIYVMSPSLTDEIIYAGTVGGATRFFQIGGAQAIAAAAFGTDTIPRADMVVGPGNAFVAEAKRQLIGTIGIDMLAGPSEIAIIADEQAKAEWVALDVLSQAEHDPDAIAFVITTSESVATSVREALAKRLLKEADRLPNFISESVGKSQIKTFDSLAGCVDFVNEIAPEHLLLHVSDAYALVPSLKNFGALFIGENATVPYGDYVAGPNHTLPTGGTARFSSGLSPLTFLRTQTWMAVPKPCVELSKFTQRFAEIEGLLAHSDAAAERGMQATQSRTQAG